MYSRKAWGGPVDPFILVKFLNGSVPDDVKDPTVSMLIFEWDDLDLIGVPGQGPENVSASSSTSSTSFLISLQ